MPPAARPGPRPAAAGGAALLLVLLLLVAGPHAAHALDPGASAVVAADGDCLRLRANPGLSGQVLACLPDGSAVLVLSALRAADGHDWHFVDAGGGRSGWVVAIYLRAASAAPAATPPPAAATAAATQATPAPPAVAAPRPALGGSIPAAGGFGLAVFGGGPVDAAVAAARDAGCNVAAVWANRTGGGLVGYLVGAPAFVNAPWADQYGEAPLPAATPLIVVCRAAAGAPPASGGGSAPPAATPPAGPAPQPGLPPGVPASPPGPAGNA